MVRGTLGWWPANTTLRAVLEQERHTAVGEYLPGILLSDVLDSAQAARLTDLNQQVVDELPVLREVFLPTLGGFQFLFKCQGAQFSLSFIRRC